MSIVYGKLLFKLIKKVNLIFIEIPMMPLIKLHGDFFKCLKSIELKVFIENLHQIECNVSHEFMANIYITSTYLNPFFLFDVFNMAFMRIKTKLIGSSFLFLNYNFITFISKWTIDISQA